MDINIDLSGELDCSPNTKSSGFTQLMYISKNSREINNSLDLIKNILDNNPEELNKQNTRGWTSLMLAARNSNTTSTLETVALLLRYKPDLSITEETGKYNALLLSCQYSRHESSIDTVQLLSYHTDDIDNNNNAHNALSIAVGFSSTTSDINTVKFLLDLGANINYLLYTNHNNYLSIFLVGIISCLTVNINNLEACKLLLDRGADINTRDINKINALHYVFMCKDNVNTEDRSRIIDFLLENNISKEKSRVLIYMLYNNQVLVKDFIKLVEHDYDVNAQDTDYNTCLMHIVSLLSKDDLDYDYKKNLLDILEYLVYHDKIDFSLKNSRTHDIFDVAHEMHCNYFLDLYKYKDMIKDPGYI